MVVLWCITPDSRPICMIHSWTMGDNVHSKHFDNQQKDGWCKNEVTSFELRSRT